MNFNDPFKKSIQETFVSDISKVDFFNYLYSLKDFYWNRLMYYHKPFVEEHGISKDAVVQDAMCYFCELGKDGLDVYTRFSRCNKTLFDLRFVFKNILKWKLYDAYKTKENEKSKIDGLLVEYYSDINDINNINKYISTFDSTNLEWQEFISVCRLIPVGVSTLDIVIDDILDNVPKCQIAKNCGLKNFKQIVDIIDDLGGRNFFLNYLNF